MSSRALLVGILLLAAALQPATAPAAAAGEAFRNWAGRDDAVFVLIVADGLRPDHLDRIRPDGSPLMPRLTARRADALRFTNCESSNSNLAGGLYQLLAATDFAGLRAAREAKSGDAPATGLLALSQAGFQSHFAISSDALRQDELLAAAAPGWKSTTADVLVGLASSPGRHLVVIYGDWLLPPFELESELIDSLDREPWLHTPKNKTIEDHRRERGEAALRASGSREWPRNPSEMEADAFVRALEAAHAQADRQIGAILDRLQAEFEAERLCIALTANSSTALGEHGAWGVAAGAHRASVSVPLWLFAGGAGAELEAPTTPADLAFTLASSFGAPTDEATGCVDLFTSIPADRIRLHVGRGAAGFCDGSVRFVQQDSGSAFLFDALNDPGGLVDLHATHGDLTRQSRQRLLALLGLDGGSDLSRWLSGVD